MYISVITKKFRVVALQVHVLDLDEVEHGKPRELSGRPVCDRPLRRFCGKGNMLVVGLVCLFNGFVIYHKECDK